ncbi:apoptosis regulator BAX isoform X2 [Stegostoma tigrinum]|uniref:apoptosis regulator BAX isoform X2 n=1 Tax=Stegostoma tigrinum TaxID=3053191 RepID=UPI00202BA098|nr:apoptosis regulator BAX isoform X2 [Stegostoma tigrinum]
MESFSRRVDAEHGAAASGSVNRILDKQSEALVRRFVLETILEEDPQSQLSPEDLGGTRKEIDDPSVKEICKSLKKIGDELNRNVELQHVIETVPLDNIREVLRKVAEGILVSDGLNWGRIVIFLYFSSRLVFKALKNLRSMIQPIINWSLDLIRARVIPWIEQQGGWETIYSYIGTPTWQTFAAFSAGLITGVLVIMRLT